MRKIILLLSMLTLSILFSACGPTRNDQQATITQIARDIFNTRTAQVPASTSTSTATASPAPTSTKTATPQPTETQIPTNTLVPDMIVLALKIQMREGFGSTAYGSVAFLFQGDTADVIGRDEDCTNIKVKDSKGNVGWIPYDEESLELNIDCAALPIGSFRPLNGTIVLDKRNTKGLGEFEVQNGLDVDGVILLADAADTPLVAFYIRGGEHYTLNEIPDNTYWVFFSTGEEWNSGENRFAENVRRQKFEEPFPFTTHSGQYTLWSITLHGVTGGQARTDAIPEDDFPSLED